MSTGGSFLPPDVKVPQFDMPTGGMFPTQNAQGGWEMPQQRQALVPPVPAPAPQAPAPMPGNAFMNYWNSPQLGMGLKSIPNIGAAQQQAYMQGMWSPGMGMGFGAGGNGGFGGMGAGAGMGMGAGFGGVAGGASGDLGGLAW